METKTESQFDPTMLITIPIGIGFLLVFVLPQLIIFSPILLVIVLGVIFSSNNKQLPKKSIQDAIAPSQPITPVQSSNAGGNAIALILVCIPFAAFIYMFFLRDKPEPQQYYPVYSTSQPGAAWVDGYYKTDGTYVQGHYRTQADGIYDNNWSTQGNVNPYTGKPGAKHR